VGAFCASLEHPGWSWLTNTALLKTFRTKLRLQSADRGKTVQLITVRARYLHVQASGCFLTELKYCQTTVPRALWVLAIADPTRQHTVNKRDSTRAKVSSAA